MGIKWECEIMWNQMESSGIKWNQKIYNYTELVLIINAML